MCLLLEMVVSFFSAMLLLLSNTGVLLSKLLQPQSDLHHDSTCYQLQCSFSSVNNIALLPLL